MSHQFDPSSQHTEAKVEGTPSEEIHDTHGETRYFLAKLWGPGDSRIAVVEHGTFDLNELVVEPTHLKHIIQSNWIVLMKDRGENKQYLKPPTSFGIPLLFPIVLGEMMFVEHQSFFPCKNFLGYRILGVLQIFTLISSCKLEIHRLLTLSTTTAATEGLRLSKMPKTSS